MKFLTLFRHSSAVHDSSYRDFDRPLREKGVEKTRRTTELIIKAEVKPDFLISSPAARALETAELFASFSGYGFTPDSIQLDERLYLPSPGDILDCVRNLDDCYSDVFLFSHNNGISWAAQEFCNDPGIIMPTGAAVRISFNTDSWFDIIFGSGIKTGFFP